MSLPHRLIRPFARPARRLLRRFGYDVVAAETAPPPDARRHWMQALGIDTVIDVGANEGQFVGWIRQRGYTGPVISFEPQAAAFAACQARWGHDRAWTGIRCALGETPGEIDLQIAGNSMSSSILPMLGTHVAALPESAIVSTERVRVGRLDAELGDRLGASARTFLKIDTQGFELPVIRGAAGMLDRVAFLELELSLVSLYAGQALMPEVCVAVQALGFTPVWMEHGFWDSAEVRLLQLDGLFVKTALLTAQ